MLWMMSKSCLNMFEPYLDVCSFLLPHSTARSSPWELLEHGDTPDPSGPAWAAPCCRLWRLDAAASPSPSLLHGCLVGTWLVLPILRQNFFWLLGACAVAGVVSRERDSACSQLHQRSFRAVDPQRRFGFGGVVFFQPQVHAAGRQQPIGSGVYSQRRLRCRELEQPLGASDVFQRGGLPRGAISKRWHVGIVHSNESGKKETVATPCGISCWRTVTQHLHLAGEWTSFAVFLLCCLEFFLVVGSLWKGCMFMHVHALFLFTFLCYFGAFMHLTPHIYVIQNQHMHKLLSLLVNIRKHGARGSASIGQNFKIVSAIVVACTVSQWCFVGFPYLNFYDSCRLLCCFLFHFALSWYIDIFCSIFYLFLLNFGECSFFFIWLLCTFIKFYRLLCEGVFTDIRVEY